MFSSVLHMVKLPDPVRWARRWAAGQRRRDDQIHESRKPKLTREEARRDHWQMLRFMALHAFLGVLIGAGVGAALILLDIGGLRGLMARASSPVLPVLLVVVPFASLFGAAAAASAILTMPYETKYRAEENDAEEEREEDR